ncbi:MAG: hypothetical protein M3220_10730 [Chloroflexota bacterium]|nr:hypothetical protein [Chloroflexota bacterium]
MPASFGKWFFSDLPSAAYRSIPSLVPGFILLMLVLGVVGAVIGWNLSRQPMISAAGSPEDAEAAPLTIPATSLAPSVTAAPNDTTPGTILPLGEAWQARGRLLTLAEATEVFGTIQLRFILRNETSEPLPLRFQKDDAKQIMAEDNLGRGYVYRPQALAGPRTLETVLEPGAMQEIPVTLRPEGDFALDHPEVDALIVRISTAGVENARWQVPAE